MSEEELIKNPVSMRHKILCLMTVTYSIINVLIFLMGIINIPLLNKIFQIYTDTPPESYQIILYVSLSLLWSLGMFYGAYKLFKNKKRGYYFLVFSSLALIATKIYFNNRNFMEIGFIVLILLLFTICIKKYN